MTEINVTGPESLMDLARRRAVEELVTLIDTVRTSPRFLYMRGKATDVNPRLDLMDVQDGSVAGVTPASGLLKGLTIEQIFALTLEKEAIEFLKAISGNSDTFWTKLYVSLHSNLCAGWYGLDSELPISLEKTRQRVYSHYQCGPFGNPECEPYQRNHPKLVKLLQGGGNLTDLHDPAAIVEWLDKGLILWADDHLVFNSFWQPYIDSLRATLEPQPNQD